MLEAPRTDLSGCSNPPTQGSTLMSNGAMGVSARRSAGHLRPLLGSGWGTGPGRASAPWSPLGFERGAEGTARTERERERERQLEHDADEATERSMESWRETDVDRSIDRWPLTAGGLYNRNAELEPINRSNRGTSRATEGFMQ